MICPDCGKRLKVMNTRTDENEKETVRSLFCKNCSRHYYTVETLVPRDAYRKVAIEFERERNRVKIIRQLHSKG